jgi:Homeodomain-like domain
MRYPACEKLEIIRLVEESALPLRRTLEKVDIPRATFYRRYDLYQAGGPEPDILSRIASGGALLEAGLNALIPLITANGRRIVLVADARSRIIPDWF